MEKSSVLLRINIHYLIRMHRALFQGALQYPVLLQLSKPILLVLTRLKRLLRNPTAVALNPKLPPACGVVGSATRHAVQGRLAAESQGGQACRTKERQKEAGMRGMRGRAGRQDIPSCRARWVPCALPSAGPSHGTGRLKQERERGLWACGPSLAEASVFMKKQIPISLSLELLRHCVANRFTERSDLMCSRTLTPRKFVCVDLEMKGCEAAVILKPLLY